MTHGLPKSKVILAVLGMALGLLVAGGVVSATSSTDEITACVDKAGHPRIVVSDSQCKTNETVLTWSQQGPAGSASKAWVKAARMGDTNIELPVNPDNAPGVTPQVTLDVPDPLQGGGYLMSVTIGVVNNGSVDAGILCAVDDFDQQQLFVPMNDQSGTEFGGSLSGVFGSASRSFTITGTVDHGGTVGATCWINKWQGQPSGTPSVSIWSAVLTAHQVDQLTIE